jgi:hypothetical protein
MRRRPIRRSNYRWLPHPKPANVLRYELLQNSAVRKYPDGREVCQDNLAGRREYLRRVQVMLQRQNFRCSLCGKRLSLDNATFEHARRRGMGSAFRDDRISNGTAAHWVCNAAKG